MGRPTKERSEVESHQATLLDVKKSNTLISAKGHATLLQHKFLTIGLKFATFSSEENTMIARLNASQLRNILGVKGNSLYQHITALVMPQKDKTTLTDWKIVYRDDETKKVHVANVIQDADYSDGVLVIRYNNRLTQYMDNLIRNYTVLPLKEIMSLQSMYSYRLYEVLKSHMDRERSIRNISGAIVWQEDLVEIKLLLGIIDASANGDIVKALNSGAGKYEKIEQIEEAQPRPMYSDYSNFRKRVLDPAIDEINKKTSLQVSYTPIRENRKVKYISFTIDSRSADKEKRAGESTDKADGALTEDEKLEILMEVRGILDKELFGTADIRAIAEAAEYDLEKVRNAAVCLDFAGDVQNPTGWMIAAVKNGYQKPKGRKKILGPGFEQRTDYDLNELEELLVEK